MAPIHSHRAIRRSTMVTALAQAIRAINTVAARIFTPRNSISELLMPMTGTAAIEGVEKDRTTFPLLSNFGALERAARQSQLTA